ncbi:Rrf2 family transcriptional regulator [Taibaiella lutea]|uniref:Rrf2 family transcriptional regulator n=1 Tax=Taibaiella lutea TaxID=2608001 RepID=A0A5M6CR43_9BACT|nr:Rrf2 family transcriptional regulator [Taibaiella lutea]KAA5536850.1 Rrf2 family transcriptional regulator [Taibaiella lutea]
MINGRFALAIHILSLLSMEEGVSSEYIASNININPVLVRKELSRLSKANLIITKEGKNGGSYLACSPKKITLADVYKATYEKPLFNHSKNTPNPQCPMGSKIGLIMEDVNKMAEAALLKKLKSISIEQFNK